MATLNEWVAGARPRTFPAAVAPVLIGTAAAHLVGSANVAPAILALLVSLSLQIGVNYANDYSDGILGVDDDRVGPTRLVGQRLAAPGTVRLAAFTAFGAAAIFGLTLVALTQTWILLIVGVLAIAAAWRYTGGDDPYGYRGLGEVYVFVFFGLVATLGTQYTQSHLITPFGILGAIGVGCIASSLLLVNNLRDIYGDEAAGKITVAVSLGSGASRVLFWLLILLALCMIPLMGTTTQWVMIALASAVFAFPPMRRVAMGYEGAALVPALAGTGLFEFVYALLIFVAAMIAGPFPVAGPILGL